MAVADKTYYLDENKELTTDQEQAAFVLINKGQEIPRDMADKYGIGKVAQEGETDAAEGDESSVEEKAAQPSANKSKKPTENKGAK